MNDDLRSYFEQIEAAFCANRGAPLLLSPLDFEKVVEWHAAGVPLEVVEAGIADYFARLAARKVPLRRAICLSFAEDRILRALDAHRAAAVGRSAGVAETEPQELRVARFLEDRATKLEAFASGGSLSTALPLLGKFCAGAAREIRELIPKAGQSLTSLEARLQPLDREMGRMVLIESPEAMVGGWKKEARALLGDLASGMEEGTLRQALENLACKAGLAHWGLPRLSLLYLED